MYETILSPEIVKQKGDVDVEMICLRWWGMGSVDRIYIGNK